MADLSRPSQENVAFMIEEIKLKLRMASGAAMQASHFGIEHYEDIKDVYDIVSGKSTFSISEVEALVSELGKLRSRGNAAD